MKRWVCVVGSMMAAVSTAWGASPQFPSAVFTQTIRGRSLGATGFPWPSMTSFRSAWDEAQQVRLIQVADVRLSDGESALLELRARPDQHTSVEVITAESRDGYYEARRLVSGRWPVEISNWKAGKSLSLQAGDREASIEVVRVSEPGTPAGQALYDDWIYLSVLLAEGHAKEGEFVIPRGACSMDVSP